MKLTLLPTDLNALLAFAPSQQPGQEPPSILASIVPMVLMIAVFYFILIRPQMKAKKDQDNMVSTLKAGDKVVTSGGIFGTVTSVRDGSVMLSIAENVKIEVLKAHITARTESEK
ncbi:MAG: preprotein translocase subunit YajC [Verrucomicrobiota bacterium]